MSKRGLYHKYNITHADGSPINPNAFYLVLRLDSGEHQEACLDGAEAFAHSVMDSDPELGDDVLQVIADYWCEMMYERAGDLEGDE